ncbi:MAG TPA: transglutaminase domain-containing protein, partial [Symbiobacteriaceae bacterium]|nr:transglutaminase domain-containing protein [Symbiobacteriaceae bacterium]
PRYLLFLLAVIPLWATGAAVAREDRWWRAGRRVVEGTHWAASLVLGLLVAGAAGWLLPAPAALDLGPASAWLRQTFPAMANMRGPQSQAETDPQGFNLAAAGFARRLTELGGPVRPVDDVAMRLTLLSGTVEETLYLRGTAMTNYTGRGWAQETRPGSVGDDVPPMGQELTLEMTPVGISGNTIFYPREIMAVRGIDAYQFGRESYLFSRERLMQPYQVQAYRPAGRPAASMPLMFDPGRYLALPGDLPARVRHLAADLTSSQPTPYDEALAIEAYLRNLPYDMGVPATPPGRDFVDYFLFDLRRGYCTYSATAMVVMLRSESIPARWVQGFAAVPGETEVRWSSAHAWVEAYFPGYGWAVFDPTPRFTLPARLSQEQAGAAVSILEPGPGVEEPSVSTVPPSPEATSAEGRFPWWLGAVVLVALAYAATSVQAFYKERIDWRDERAGLVQAFTLLASALGRMGLPRLSHQTPAEYAGDVAGAWPELGPAVRQVAADVTAALYARPGAPLPDGARRRMGGTMAALWDRARGRWGIVRTAWIRFRYLWGKD